MGRRHAQRASCAAGTSCTRRSRAPSARRGVDLRELAEVDGGPESREAKSLHEGVGRVAVAGPDQPRDDQRAEALELERGSPPEVAAQVGDRIKVRSRELMR